MNLLQLVPFLLLNKLFYFLQEILIVKKVVDYIEG